MMNIERSSKDYLYIITLLVLELLEVGIFHIFSPQYLVYTVNQETVTVFYKPKVNLSWCVLD